ncbi:ABC transporter permease [Promicromonospora sp. NPDC060271]|uniref:ABC transporter permease n=1 Tax=Promicromonospora sp. NPDC060271 TaxID=3347089 RepID=UPI00365D6070
MRPLPSPARNPYWRFLVAGFRGQSAYPLATLAGLVANATFGLLKGGIMGAAVESSGGELAGYSAATMAAFVWLGQGMLGSVNFWGGSDLQTRIKSGDVAVDFLRPVSVQAANVLTDIGKGLFALLPRGLPSVVIGVLVSGMALPPDAAAYALGLTSLLIGIAVSHATVYAVATSGFWLVETRGVSVLYMAVSGFFAGLFTPIYLFPDWLLTLALLTPFPAMMQFPIDVLSGQVTGSAVWQHLGVQLVWLAVVLVVGHLTTRAGRRRLEVQGG